MHAADAPADVAERVRAAMAPSLAQQKASVQVQASTALPQTPKAALDSAGGFFTVPWPAPPAFTAASFNAPCDPLPGAQIDALVSDAATRHAVTADLVRAVIDQESGGRPCAVSGKGAQGLMQLMPAVAAELKVADVFDPGQNVDAGVRLLKQLLDKYKGSTALALAAYNAGSGRVDRDGGVPPIAETQKYVADITSKAP